MSHPGTKRALALAGLGVVSAVGIGFLWPHPQPLTSLSPNQTAAQQNTAMPAGKPPVKASAITPSFDVVRINPNGDAVIAGRAAPEATVIILDGDREIGRVTADKHGEWVFMPGAAMALGSHELHLKAIGKDGGESESDAPITLSVPGRAGGTVLAVKTLPDGRSIVLQGPAAASDSGPLSIDVLDFNDKGDISVSGRAEPDKRIVLYLDNVLLGDAQSNGEGAWSAQAKSKALADGEHHLRADEVRPDGGVITRVEVTFSVGMDKTAQSEITVQPGNSLWRIARNHYGHGIAYTVIYQANKAFIRDPNLIYPGQVFKLPEK